MQGSLIFRSLSKVSCLFSGVFNGPSLIDSRTVARILSPMAAC